MESPTETKLRKEVANLLFSKMLHVSDAVIAKVRERDAGEVDRLTDYLRGQGYRRCDIPACNCGWWHPHDGWYARFSEIEQATNDFYENGEPLLQRVIRITAIARKRRRGNDIENWEVGRTVGVVEGEIKDKLK